MFVPYVHHDCFLSKSMSSKPPALSHQMPCHIYQNLSTSVNAATLVHDKSSLTHAVVLPNHQYWHTSLPNSPQTMQIEDPGHFALGNSNTCLTTEKYELNYVFLKNYMLRLRVMKIIKNQCVKLRVRIRVMNT